MKERGEKITMLTGYDATFGRLLERAGVDMVLVGDSLGMVVQGQPNTLAVTVEDIIYHTRALARVLRRAHLVADMPFMSYQASVTEGLKNAGRLLKEAGAESVKLEGGAEHVELVRRLVESGIPVMGHVGLTPQSVHAMGGFKVQGRSAAQARRIYEDALALEEAGCYAVVLEGVPVELSARITRTLQIPTIGIGAGAACDGQVLVLYDLLGMDDGFRPKFVKRYDDLCTRVVEDFRHYIDEVRSGAFPAEEHTFHSAEAAGFAPRLVEPDEAPAFPGTPQPALSVVRGGVGRRHLEAAEEPTAADLATLYGGGGGSR
jgi:3-methyl-2-oxobutanoate hydroxymethyltransferase